MEKIILGIDIGGSHITSALVNMEKQTIAPGSRIRESVNSHDSAEAIIMKWCDIIKESFASYNLSPGKIGVAMPGPFDYTAGISMMNNQNKYKALYGLNIKELLTDQLSINKDDIGFRNDAECFLAGESFSGAAKDFKKVLGISLGTGFGTAWCTNGVAEDAELWRCTFKDSIAEHYFATAWFVKRYKEATGINIKDVKELAGLAVTKEQARAVFNEFGKNLSDFLQVLIHKHKPEVLVIGGNVAKAFDLFYHSLKNGFEEHDVEIPVLIAKLGEDAALIGAAAYWDSNYIMANQNKVLNEVLEIYSSEPNFRQGSIRYVFADGTRSEFDEEILSGVPAIKKRVVHEK